MNEQSQKHSKVTLIVILSIIVFIGIIVGLYFIGTRSGSPNGTAQALTKGWVSYKDDRGFAVQMPESWKVNVSDWGLIRIGPDPEKADSQTTFALTMVYPQEKTKEEVLVDAKSYFDKAFSNFIISDQKNLDKYSSIISKIKYDNGDMAGVLSVTGSGKNYFLSGFAAPSNLLKDDMPDLMKTLASFNYDAKLKNPAKINNLVQMVAWKDPKEGAFTIDVPKGWTVDGGTVRPYIDAALKIILTNGDKGIQVENPYPPIYTAPNEVLSFAGFKEGSHYNPSGGISQDMIVSQEKSAQDYIQTVLSKTLNLKVDSVKPRADLVAKVPKASYITQITAAEATLGGDGKVHKVIVVEQGLTIAGIHMWTVGMTQYWAPENEISKVEQIATAMDQSFKLDPTWAKNEQVQVAKRSQIISQSGSEISDIISSTFEYRSSSQDAISEKWSDAILGVQDVYNPSTGENYTVPNNSTYYWTDGLNTVVGTDTHDSPGNYWDWQELTPVE